MRFRLEYYYKSDIGQQYLFENRYVDNIIVVTRCQMCETRKLLVCFIWKARWIIIK